MLALLIFFFDDFYQYSFAISIYVDKLCLLFTSNFSQDTYFLKIHYIREVKRVFLTPVPVFSPSPRFN